jgi:hypothetical protein
MQSRKWQRSYRRFQIFLFRSQSLSHAQKRTVIKVTSCVDRDHYLLDHIGDADTLQKPEALLPWNVPMEKFEKMWMSSTESIRRFNIARNGGAIEDFVRLRGKTPNTLLVLFWSRPIQSPSGHWSIGVGFETKTVASVASNTQTNMIQFFIM